MDIKTEALDFAMEKELVPKRKPRSNKGTYGKLYVSAILDCFNGEILALEMRDNMKKELCIDTLKQLKSKYGDISGAIFYSDRGCQYTSYAFKTVHHFWFMDSALKS